MPPRQRFTSPPRFGAGVGKGAASELFVQAAQQSAHLSACRRWQETGHGLQRVSHEGQVLVLAAGTGGAERGFEAKLPSGLAQKVAISQKESGGTSGADMFIVRVGVVALPAVYVPTEMAIVFDRSDDGDRSRRQSVDRATVFAGPLADGTTVACCVARIAPGRLRGMTLSVDRHGAMFASRRRVRNMSTSGWL
jgi:hypothetical protein